MTNFRSHPEQDLSPEPRLSARDYAANTIEAILKGVPYIGETLAQFIFGPGAERRIRRIERTLAEIGERLKPESCVKRDDVMA